MARARALEPLRRYLPGPVKRWARAVLAPTRVAETSGGGRGVIEDLFFWMADGRRDTVLPLQNYFSVLYPDLETATAGALVLHDAAGHPLGRHPIVLPAHGLTRLRVSTVLAALGIRAAGDYGTLRCQIRIPEAVLATLDPDQPFYFWDRFYIGYVVSPGPPCFVHGVDKTWIADHGRDEPRLFYASGKRYTWVPEIAIDMRLYARFSVVVVNRTTDPAPVSLTVTDARDSERKWSAEVAPFGAHRFDLDAAGVRGLASDDMRMRVDGIPTRWGRPVVVKEFTNGAISAMHC